MVDPARRTSKEKQAMIDALQKRSGGEIFSFFVSHNLGVAYESAGSKNSKAAKIAAAITEAHRLGVDDDVYESIATRFGALREGSPSAANQPSVKTKLNSDSSTSAPPVIESGHAGTGAVVDNLPKVSAGTGRRRLFVGGIVAFFGLSLTFGSMLQPPTYESAQLGLTFISGVAITTLGVLLYTQTLAHRGSVGWRTASSTTVPGLFLTISGWITYIFILRGPNVPRALETLSLTLALFGLFWATAGFFLTKRSAAEKAREERESVANPNAIKVKQRLTLAEILIIGATILQGITTLIAPLYGK